MLDALVLIFSSKLDLCEPSLSVSLDQGINPEQRKSISSATAKTLASLHRVDVDAIGLQKFGRRDNYCKRQVCEFREELIYSA